MHRPSHRASWLDIEAACIDAILTINDVSLTSRIVKRIMSLTAR